MLAPPKAQTTGVDLTSKQIKSIITKAKGSNKGVIKLCTFDGHPHSILNLYKCLISHQAFWCFNLQLTPNYSYIYTSASSGFLMLQASIFN